MRGALAASVLCLLPALAGWRTPPAGGAPPRRHVVEIRGMAFQPAVLEVAPGDTVVWVNRDIVPHTATASGGGGWDTGVMAQGESRTHVARGDDATDYHCALHPTMRGRLTVLAERGGE